MNLLRLTRQLKKMPTYWLYFLSSGRLKCPSFWGLIISFI